MTHTILPSVHLGALAELDLNVASQAMALLFYRGDREAALEYIDQLDPFIDAGFGGEIVHKKLAYCSARASLAEQAIAEGDFRVIAHLLTSPLHKEKVFKKCLNKLLAVAQKSIELQEFELADFIITHLDAPPFDASLNSRHHTDHANSNWNQLAEACAKANRLDWLEIISVQKQKAEKFPLLGKEIASKFLIKPDQSWSDEGIDQLEKMGAFNLDDYRWLAQTYAKKTPADWHRVEHFLSHWITETKQQLESTIDYYSLEYKARDLNNIVFEDNYEPIATQVEWVRIVCQQGLSGLKLASEVQRESDGTAIERLLTVVLGNAKWSESKKAVWDEKAPLLIKAFFDHGGTEGINDLKVSCSFGGSVGSKKVYLLTKVIVDQEWEMARLLMEYGADWKKAEKQVNSYVVDPKLKELALTVFESAALLKVSTKATQKRDQKIEKERLKQGLDPLLVSEAFIPPVGPKRI